ncbi:hypothetical protein HY213_04570 [Candidatus Peregrinibacteria bacterium]|nr:hypothetical protein [Candidatus Peregrinibacteria bacterium]
MEQQRSHDEHHHIPHEVRMRYWLDFARGKHRREMDLLLREAKLAGKPHNVDGRWEGWNNVIKHQAGEAAAMRMLGGALQLPEEQIEQQETFAFVHDARKHLEKARYRDFIPDERHILKKKLRKIHKEVDPNHRLRTATNEEFFFQVFERTPGKNLDEKIANTPKSELLQYYIDSIFDDGTITPALDLIAKREKRRRDLNDDPRRTKRLGMKYWSAERLLAPKVQTRIWQWLKEKGIDLPSSNALPGFIREKIEQDMVAHWLDIHGKQNVSVHLEEGSDFEVETLSDSRRRNASGVLAPEKNEDTGIIRQRGDIVMAGIFDGATNIGAPLPISPGKAASVTCREAVAGAQVDATPREILLQANGLLRGIAAGLPLTPEERSEVLCAVGAVARLDRKAKKLDVASVADCHIVVLHNDGTNTWLTQNTSEHCERLEIAAAVWGAQHPRDSLPEDGELLENLERVMRVSPEERPALKNPLEDPRVLEVIARNRRLENDLDHGGQPSLKGGEDAALAEGIQERSVRLEDGDEIFLFTDGGYPGPLHTPQQQQEVIDVLRRGGIQGLRAWVYQKEGADPLLRDPPRIKQYDDLVVMRMKFESEK